MYQNTIGGPLVKGPKGPRGGGKVLTPILGHFLLFFKVLLLSQFQAEMVLFQYGAIKCSFPHGACTIAPALIIIKCVSTKCNLKDGRPNAHFVTHSLAMAE